MDDSASISVIQACFQSIYDLRSILLALLAIVSLIYYYTQKKRQVNLPPGPPWIPLMGSIPWIDRANPAKSFAKWARKYGPVVMFYIGTKRHVFINDAKLGRDLLIKHPDVFSKRADIPLGKRNWGMEGGVIFENGDAWKTHRRWVITGLRHFGMGKRSLEEQISTEAGKLCHEIEQQHAQFNPLKYVINAVSNIICSVSFGKRYEYDDPKFQDLLGNVNAFFNYSPFAKMEAAMPFIMALFVTRRKNVNSIKQFFNTHMKEHIETFDKNNIRDLIDMILLQSEEESSSGESVPSTSDAATVSAEKSDYATTKSVTRVNGDVYSLWRAILILFLAGTDTTTSTITWFLLYMVCYPTVQTRVQDEITNATNGERPLTIRDKQKVPYFEATICEVQRLANIAPQLVMHSTNADFVVNGYDIPANTNFNLNLRLIHGDSTYWQDPLDFKPERFLDANENKFIKRDAFMPFGVGRRACLGESLAKMELYIFLSRLLQRFKFELPESSPRPSFEPVIGITQSPRPFEIVAKPL